MGADQVESELFADLEGKDAELQIVTGSWDKDSHWIVVRDRYGKVISQLNTGRKVRSMRVLADPRDNSRWLFYSINDQRHVTINAVRYEWQVPLQRQEKMFDSLGRDKTLPEVLDREWYAHIYPILLRDIDLDGRYELVCGAYDGFTADPRGLVVYDFDTGKIKWKFDTPSNPASVLVGDYDGNGSNEVIVSTHATKNTMDIRNQMDDMICWVAVLDASGKMLYHNKFTEGYSTLKLVEADTDQDGRMEIYGVNSTWGSQNIKNSVSILQWDGKQIKRRITWALSSTFEQSLEHVVLNDMDGSGKWRLQLTDKTHGHTVLDAGLNPVKHNYKEFVKAIWDVEDIDQDGKKEVLLSNANGEFVVLDSDFRVRARLRNPFPEEKNLSGYLVSTGFDTEGRIAISSGQNVKYYQYRRQPLHELLFGMARAYSGILIILLLLGWVWMIYRVRARLKRIIVISDALSIGLIEVSRRGKVLYINSHANSLYPGLVKAGKAARLPVEAPELWEKVWLMGASQSDHFELDITPSGKVENIRHQVWLLGYRRITRRLTVALIPVNRLGEDLEDKLAWADSARRLSHHVRRHITNILLALAELEQKQSWNDADRQYLQIIRGEIEKVRVFTHSFQRFTELESYNMKLQDLIPSVEHCLAHLMLPDNVKLIKNWALNSVTACIEPIRFEEAFTNIVNNALEAMPEGGTLHITVKEFPLGNSPQGKLNILVEVEDSGNGIPQKYMEEIWKPFFTTTQSGTGIGIPESRKIIESMGGKMHIQSEENVGTVVSFWLKGAPLE
jgi:signal transduction histidine kinase